MLSTNQLADLESAKLDTQNKKLILNTAVDIQVLLRILVDKQIITKDEVSIYREEVKRSPKYCTAMQYVEQSLMEIEEYEKDPQLRLRTMFERKRRGSFNSQS